MNFKLKSKAMILFSLLFVSLLVFVACGENGEEEVGRYDISGEVVGLEAKDLEQVRINANDKTVEPETEGENKGKWSISDLSENVTVRAIIDNELASQNFVFEPGEYSVSSSDDNIIFEANNEGFSYYGYEERLELACLSGESCDEAGKVARDVETVMVIDFEGEGITPVYNDLLLEDQITIKNADIGDFSVNFLNQQVPEEDLEDYKLPDNYYDEENNPVDGYDGVWEYWENVKTDYYYKSLMVRIPGRVAGDIQIEIAENTFKDEEDQKIRKIETRPLALSDDTRLDDTEDNIVSLDHYNQELVVFNSNFTEFGDDLMPSIDAIFGFDTVSNGAEIIKIAGEDVERIAEDSNDFLVEAGDKLVVRAEDGSTTEYEIKLVTGTDDVSLSSKHDLGGDDYFNLTEATKDEFGRIDSSATWLHWGVAPSEVVNGLKYADEIVDGVGTEMKVVKGDEINRSTYHDEQGYWPEDDMWDNTNKSFADLDCLIEEEYNFDKDNIIDGIGYNLVLQSVDGSIAVYDLILEMPRDTVELNNLYDEDEDDYEDRDNKVFAIDNDKDLITLRSDLDNKDLVTAEHPENAADNPANEGRNVLGIDGLNLIEAIEGGTIANVEDDELTVIAEDGRSEEVYEIEYAPGYVDSQVSNKNPYQIELNLGAGVNTNPIYTIDDLDQERFAISINGKEVEVEKLLCNDGDYDVALKLNTKMLEDDVVEISYSEDADEAYFVYDGNSLAENFVRKEVENELDPAEHVTGQDIFISDNPGQINIEFDKNVAINGDSELVAEQFEIDADWKDIGNQTPEVVDIEANETIVTLILKHDIVEADENIKVYYEAFERNDENVLALVDGDDRVVAKSFGESCDGGKIKNNITDVPELEVNEADEFAVEIVGGAEDIIELTFTEELAPNPELEEEIDFNDYFKVVVDGEEVEVEDIGGQDSSLELIIAKDLVDNESEVKISYEPELRTDSDLAALLMDAAQNHKVLDFFDVAVSNNLELAEYERAQIGVEDTDEYTASEIVVDFVNQVGEERNIAFADNIDYDNQHEDRAKTDGFTVEVNGVEHDISTINTQANGELVITLENEEEEIIVFDLEDDVKLNYDGNEGHLVDGENDHISLESFEAYVVNNLGDYDIEYANAFVREENSNIVELYFSADGKSLFSEDDNPIFSKEFANPRSVAELDIEEDEREDFLASLAVEGYEIEDASRELYNSPGNYDDFYYLEIELDDYIPANEDIKFNYDGAGYLVAEETDSALVSEFEVSLDADFKADGAMNKVEPLEMINASVDSFADRNKINIEFNKDVAGNNDVRLLSASEVETLHKNFIVDSGYTVVDVNIIDGTAESNDGVELTLSEKINTDQELNVEYKEKSKVTPDELSDGENNYLNHGKVTVENSIYFPYVSEVQALDFDTISIEFAQFDDVSPVDLDRHGEIEIEFDGESEKFAADANVNASSVTFTLEDMVVYEDEDEEKDVTISALENSTLEMIIDYYNLAENDEEFVITALPTNPVEVTGTSIANPGNSTVITLEMSHEVGVPSAVVDNLNVIKANGDKVGIHQVGANEADESLIELELDQRLSGEDGQLAVYYRGDNIVGDVNNHDIPAPDFSIDVENDLLPEVQDINAGESSAEIEAIAGDDFDDPEANEADLIEIEVELEDNFANEVDDNLQVELIDTKVTDIDENAAARVPFDDDLDFDDGEADIEFDAALPDSEEDDDYDAGEEYDFEYEVRVYTDDKSYVIIDTIDLTVIPE